MPFQSRSQLQKCFAEKARNPNSTWDCKEWAHATPNIAKLPDHKKKKEQEDKEDKEDEETKKIEKTAFVLRFLAKCASAGITDPARIVAVADAIAVDTVKKAEPIDIAGHVGSALSNLGALGVFGTVGIPLIAGAGLGAGLAKGRNTSDTNDLEYIKKTLIANAYRRRADEATMHAKVQRLIQDNPGKYSQLS